MAAKGYPGDYGKGSEIRGLEAAAPSRASRSSMPAPQRDGDADRRRRPRARRHRARHDGRAKRRRAPTRRSPRSTGRSGFCRRDIGWRAVEREKARHERVARSLPRLCRAPHQDRRARRSLLRTGGAGPPLLLLHGYPQTHVCWHKIAPELARHFTLVVPDLRGYGASSAPAGDAEHMTYSKRAMAADCLAVMRALGHRHFMVAGHDRGGRVAYRLALDHPEAVRALIPLDILPTAEMWRRITAGARDQRLPLGVPGAAVSAARDADRQGPDLLSRAHAEELDRAARSLAVLGRGAGALSRAAEGAGARACRVRGLSGRRRHRPPARRGRPRCRAEDRLSDVRAVGQPVSGPGKRQPARGMAGLVWQRRRHRR